MCTYVNEYTVFRFKCDVLIVFFFKYKCQINQIVL